MNGPQRIACLAKYAKGYINFCKVSNSHRLNTLHSCRTHETPAVLMELKARRASFLGINDVCFELPCNEISIDVTPSKENYGGAGGINVRGPNYSIPSNNIQEDSSLPTSLSE